MARRISFVPAGAALAPMHWLLGAWLCTLSAATLQHAIWSDRDRAVSAVVLVPAPNELLQASHISISRRRTNMQRYDFHVNPYMRGGK